MSHGQTIRHAMGPLVCVLVIACGCAGRSTSPFNGLPPAEARALAQGINEARERELEADLRSAWERRTPRNILVLSGGDANGAFGCGVLAGWRDAPSGRRPVFDVVTGVSTGALMATFVFLGEERDDETLRRVYTQTRDRDVMDGPFTPGPPNSVFDTGPLRRLIAQYVSREVIGRVAAAHREGRRLYVATVELDTGSVVVWPLSRIAAAAVSPDGTGQAGIERFRNVLLAAAAIPVLFPPVEIDGGLHVDAGLREALFLRAGMLGEQNEQGPGNGASPDPGNPPPTVYAIVNGKLHTEPRAVGNNLVSIGARGLFVYTEALLLFNLRDVAHLAASHDPPFRFRYVAVPDELDDAGGPRLFGSMFDPPTMRRLYRAGHAAAEQPRNFWREGLPALDDDPPGRPAEPAPDHR
jgi:patatin-like phospholipase